MKSDLSSSMLCTALMRIGTRMAAIFDQNFMPMGVSQAQFRLLMTILDRGGEAGLAPSVLAEYLLLERATVTVLSSRLVERGLLVRMPGENRRTFNLVLTASGGMLLNEVLPRAIALAERTLAGIVPGDLRQTLLLLDTVESRLRAGGLSPASEEATHDQGE